MPVPIAQICEYQRLGLPNQANTRTSDATMKPSSPPNSWETAYRVARRARILRVDTTRRSQVMMVTTTTLWWESLSMACAEWGLGSE